MKDSFDELRLLDRKPPDGYLEELTILLTQQKNVKSHSDEVSVLIFRLQNEWLAIATTAIKDVMEIKPIHVIPHRNNQTLKGIANIGGQLKLVVSLDSFLEIKKAGSEPYSKMIVIKQDDVEWVVLVHDIYGVRSYNLNLMENVPVTVLKSTANYLKGIYQFDKYSVGVLEEELLFFSLQRSVG